MGASQLPVVNQVSLEYTSTKSIFSFDVAGKVRLDVTFLSPVYPDDLSRQSQQFSYIAIKVVSSDGSPHNVKVYMDVSAGESSFSRCLDFMWSRLTSSQEWASGDHSAVVNWDTGSSGNLKFHKFFRADQQEFKESGEIASWGTWYLTTASGNGVSITRLV